MINALTRRLALAGVVATLSAPFGLAAQATSEGTSQATSQAPQPTRQSPLDFSGWTFGSFQYRTDSTARAANGNRGANQFGIDRAYLTFRLPAGERALVRVTTDFYQQQNSAYYSGWAVRIKYAYLQYDIAKDIGNTRGLNLTARIGVLHTVTIDHEETFWPRFYTQTAVERNGFFSSADVGAVLQLQLPKNYGEIYGTITNGPGYTSSDSDRFKDFAVRASISPFPRSEFANGYFRTFTISPWIYRGFTASKFQNDPATVPAGWNGIISGPLARDRWGLFTGVKDRRLTLGAEYARRTEDVESGNNVVSSPRTLSQRRGELMTGFAILHPLEWGIASKPSPIGFIARIDRFRPNTNAATTSATVGPDAADRFILGGIFWETTAHTTLALDYQRQTRSNGSHTPEQRSLYLHWQATF